MSTGRCDVLLVAAGWQSRALLLAELQEAGHSVIAAPGLRYALRALLGQRVHPRLILLDIQGDEDATPGYVEQIRELAPGIPLLLLVGAYDLSAWRSLSDHLVEVLRRPLTVGEVVEAVRRGLGEVYSV